MAGFNVITEGLVITGTRIPVEVLVGYRASGKKVREIANLYDLDVNIVRKALEHVERTSVRQVS